jgi:dephospho-CoA kinase
MVQRLNRLTTEQRLYHLNRPIIGLTGGIATGKSTAARYLAQKGHAVICADDLVKKIYAHNSEVHEFLHSHIPQVISDKNLIDFKQLRTIFFGDKEIKHQLEQLIYKNLPEAFNEEVEKYPEAPLIIYDVPLLFERKMEKFFDLVILVYLPREIQLKRLMARDQISEDLARTIISKQMDIEDKKHRASIVFENNMAKDWLFRQIDLFFKQFDFQR